MATHAQDVAQSSSQPYAISKHFIIFTRCLRKYETVTYAML
ncbi:hypothetical protein SAMN05421740_103313 [Parapedobacter koreensis]|uniref:Uncharacterized protein n=1 Tax=Parapedobacter koreensis TaxID=332977 RepID=A0A1H7LYX2_9SPHI|nr:hypothetical protein SAMN05421740_103313 [Parapedobacter koreensis]